MSSARMAFVVALAISLTAMITSMSMATLRITMVSPRTPLVMVIMPRSMGSVRAMFVSRLLLFGPFPSLFHLFLLLLDEEGLHRIVVVMIVY